MTLLHRVYCTECGGSSSFDKLPFLKNMLFMQTNYPRLVTIPSVQCALLLPLSIQSHHYSLQSPSPPPSRSPSLRPVAPHPTASSSRSPSTTPFKSTIVPSAGSCSDSYPYGDGFTCQQQATWGKCGEEWMKPPVCMRSCGRCT